MCSHIFKIPFPPLTFRFSLLNCEPAPWHAASYQTAGEGRLAFVYPTSIWEKCISCFSYIRNPLRKYDSCLYAHCGKWAGWRKIRVLYLRIREPRDGVRRKLFLKDTVASLCFSLYLLALVTGGSVSPHGRTASLMAELRVNTFNCALLTLSNQTIFTSFVTSPWSSLSSMPLPWPSIF